MVVVGPLRQRGQVGRLLDRELAQLLVEIVERGGGHAVGVHAEENFVEVELEDLVLGVGALDAQREHGLLELAVHVLVAGQQEVLRHLLRDGRGALRPLGAEVLQIVHERAHHAQVVDAAVIVEAPVLGRQERCDGQLGHGADGHEDAPLARVLADDAAVGCVYARHHGGFVLGEAGVVRQVLGRLPDVVDDREPKARQRTRQRVSRPPTRAGIGAR